MDRYIGLDAHASSCTLGVVSPSGKRLGHQVVETNAQALVGHPGDRGPASLLVLSPLDFLAALARLIPPPRVHRHRYHGVLAHMPWSRRL